MSWAPEFVPRIKIILKKLINSRKSYRGVTITPNNFSDDGCYRLFFARFVVIFRVMGVIGGHWRTQIRGDGSLRGKWRTLPPSFKSIFSLFSKIFPQFSKIFS